MKNFKNFLHTTIDVFRIYWEIAPGLTVGVLITEALLALQGPVNIWIFGIFLDSVISAISESREPSEIFPVLLLYLLITLVLSVIGVINGYFNSILSSIDIAKLRLKHTNLMIKLGISQMENADLTNKSTRFTEVYPMMNQHLVVLISLVAIIISTIAYGVVVYSFAPFLVFVVLIIFILKYAINSKFINRLWLLNRNYTEKRRNAWDSIHFLASPSGLKEILLLGGSDFFQTKFLEYIDWFNLKFKEIRNGQTLYEFVSMLVDNLIYGIGIFLLIEKAILGAFSIGTFTFYLRALGSFSGQLDRLTYRIARAIESSIRLQDALEIFELYKPDPDGSVLLSDEFSPPTIELKDLSFKYPNGKKSVIKNLNLSISPGEKIAIVGENGAGKTTLVKLLTRIYRPQEGEIIVNNTNLNDISRESWYSKLGVLFQDFNSYANLTVLENIVVGKISKKINLESVKFSLKKADALEFVEKYPNKLDQILSERYKGGIRPSGGQWQKLAIARIFYRNAPILIMDEPTASIDAVSEASIFDNIYKFMKGKTVIIISHRFSTVRNADRILVLDKGKIIEEGSHEELLKLKGKYAHAFHLQAKGYS